MFKSAFRTLLVVASFTLAGVAGATPVTFSDVVNPVDVFFKDSDSQKPYSFVHDIRDSGFNPLTDIISSISITMRFRDDADKAPEAVKISFDDVRRDVYSIRSGSCVCVPSVLNEALAASLMQADGWLNVLLARKQGDFFFMDSTLVVNAERGPAPGTQVPEPAMELLTGLALLSLGLIRRRRRQG